MAQNTPPEQVRDYHLRDADGILRHVLQLSAAQGEGGPVVYVPAAVMDFPLATPEEPTDPPEGRVRCYVIDRVVQARGPGGAQGDQGEIIATDANGIRRIVPPGAPGSILLRDPSNDLGVTWGQVLTISDIPGQYQFGSRLSYSADANAVASQIQYTKVYLIKDVTISTMRVYRTTGGSGARFIRLGIYDQADPEDRFGVPQDRLAQTASTATTGTNSYITPPLTAPWVVPVTGFYWIAFITDTATPLRFQVTAGVYPPGFLPVYRQAGAGTTLPATASALTQPASAVLFAGGLE